MSKKAVFAICIVLVVLAALFPGCRKKAGEPFTLDYKIDKSNMKYYTEGDTAATIMIASPFYAGAQPFPGMKTAEYDKARRAKVEEIISEADKVVKTSAKIKGKVDKLRTAYLDYLTVCSKEEPKLKGFTKATVKEIIALQCKETAAEFTYQSIATDSKKPFAKAYMEHMKAAKGVEIGGLYMRDVNNIVGYSALALEALKDSKNEKIKQANSKLDKEMGQLNSMKGDLKNIAVGLNKIDYGFKQIETSDYYMAKSALAFMDSKMPDLKAKLKTVKPKEKFTAEDVAFTKSYLGEVEQACNKLRKVLGTVDESKLVKVSLASDNAIITPAWAQDSLSRDTFQLSYNVLKKPSEQAGFMPTDILKGGWNAAKTIAHTAQKVTGAFLDATGAATKSIMDVPMGLYYGNKCSEIGERIGSNFRQVASNIFAGKSGTEYLREAKSYVEGADSTVGGAASDTAAWMMGGEGWTSWAAGGVGKATAGVFTDMAKGIYAVADPTSSKGELAVGAMNIGFGFMGGSKALVKGSHVPGAAKGAGEGTEILAKKGLNFLERQAANAELGEMKVLMKEGVMHAQMPHMQMLAKGMSQEAVKEALEQTSKELNQKMAQFISSNASAWAGASKETMKKELNDFVQTQFQANMTGFAQSIKTALGGSPVGYFDTVVGQMADDALKDMVETTIDTHSLDGTYSGSLSGSASGSISFTIKGNSVSGSTNGSRNGNPYNASFSGSFSQAGETGVISCNMGGQQKYEKEWYSFSGSLRGSVKGSSASGTWSASGQGESGQGSWTAHR